MKVQAFKLVIIRRIHTLLFTYTKAKSSGVFQVKGQNRYCFLRINYSKFVTFQWSFNQVWFEKEQQIFAITVFKNSQPIPTIKHSYVNHRIWRDYLSTCIYHLVSICYTELCKWNVNFDQRNTSEHLHCVTNTAVYGECTAAGMKWTSPTCGHKVSMWLAAIWTIFVPSSFVDNEQARLATSNK